MSDPLRLAVISTSRSDLGLLLPVVRAAVADPRFAVELLITGTHLGEGTPGDGEISGLPAVRLPRPADSLGLVHQVAMRDRLRGRCDVALILGDRVELLELGCALVHAEVAIAHCSGGERTAGAWDDQVRDAVTRLAHLHYPAHRPAAERLIAMGEEPWRIAATGEPGLDDVIAEPRLSSAELAAVIGSEPRADDLLVAIHPVTRSPAETAALVVAVRELGRTHRLLLSSPNGDPGSEAIRGAWQALAVDGHIAFGNHGARVFRSLAAIAGVVLGNSSAGLVEAPGLGATTVDLGTRQGGRLRGVSVVSVPEPTPGAVLAAVARARALPRPLPADNPYGDGRAVPRLLDHLHGCGRRSGLLVKA